MFVFQLDVLEQDTLDVLQLIRAWRNRLAPINQIPPEILTLLPDFWYEHDGRGKDVIALTHVCRAWREAFTSRPSLWTNIHSTDQDKSEVYLERSDPLSIRLPLRRVHRLSPHDPFFQIIPRAIGRLGYLSVETTPENLQDINAHLSLPAPLLEMLSIHGGCEDEPHRNPTLPSTLFDDDLSSLRTLCLQSVRTELPWRNMTNLTSFTLTHTAPGEVSVNHLLDFFENAPSLHKIHLFSATLTHGTQDRRLVSLPCLKRMSTTGGDSSSLLLDHLLIPVGACLTTEVEFPGPPVGGRPPGFLKNLRNLVNFTSIRLYGDPWYPHMEFRGPNGEVKMTHESPQAHITSLVLNSLAHFDSSKTEQLEIIGDPLSGNPLYYALLPMNDLRTLTLTRCWDLHTFIRALYPSTGTPSGIVVCPKLEDLVLDLKRDGEEFNIQDMIGTMEARASRGAKLRTLRIVDGNSEPKLDREDVLDLRKHAQCVEYGPGGGRFWYSDEED